MLNICFLKKILFFKNFLKLLAQKTEKNNSKEVIMNKIKNTLKRLWDDESGQGATEYILILVVVAAIVIAFRTKIVQIIKDRTGEVGNKIRDAIK